MSKGLPKIIEELRKKRGWTQELLASKLRVQQSTVSRWERGETVPVGLYLESLNRMITRSKVR